MACYHCQQTLTGILSAQNTHTHTLPRSLCLLTAAGPPQGSCEVKICYIMQPCIDFPPLEVGQLPARSETGDESCRALFPPATGSDSLQDWLAKQHGGPCHVAASNTPHTVVYDLPSFLAAAFCFHAVWKHSRADRSGYHAATFDRLWKRKKKKERERDTAFLSHIHTHQPPRQEKHLWLHS